MDLNQPTVTTTTTNVYVPPKSSGIFGSKLPSGVAFGVAVLLFLLPFAELKCNSKSDATKKDGFDFNMGSMFKITNSGLGLAMGSNWKMGGMGGFMNEKTDSVSEKMKPKPNMYAIAALALGVLGLVFALVINSKAGGFIGVVAGVLGAAALIGLMFDLKKQIKNPVDRINSTGSDSMDWGVDQLKDITFTVGFTPWFYLAIIAFLTGAFFCFRRMNSPTLS